MYKFQGDGWILLFDDAEVSGRKLIALLKGLSREYRRLFDKHVADVLTNLPNEVGLTFGVDEGSLMTFVMNKQREYVGRPINVAARLQSAIKNLSTPPAGALLMSTNAFARLRMRDRGKLIECKLRSVPGGARYRVRKILIQV